MKRRMKKKRVVRSRKVQRKAPPAKKRCKAITQTGKRCKHLASINGYCLTHL